MAESNAVAAAAPAQVAKPQAPVESVSAFVKKNRQAIADALPNIGLTAEAVARTALSQVYKNPQLSMCDHVSLMRAIIEAASLGLSFALGRAYLVPFNNKLTDPVTGRESWRMEAQFMPGYQGLVDLVRRSASVKTVAASAVYEGDTFSYSTGLTDDTFQHVSLTDPDASKLTHAYCIIRFLDGGYQFVVLTRKQIDAVRERSKAKSKGPWVTDYDAMAIKTAVKRCTKLCPASIELARAIELDNAAEIGERQNLSYDGKLVGEGDTATGSPAPIDVAPTSTTQAVSQQAAEVLKTAREAAPETSKGEQPTDAPKAAPAPPAAKPGPGRPPLAACPGFGGEPCPKKAKLHPGIEQEFNLCEACQVRQTNAQREENGTAVAATEASLSADPSPEEFGRSLEGADAIQKLAARARANFMIDADGSLSRAEIALSELSGGKVQKFDDLADYLRAHPEFMAKLQEAMR